MSKEENQRAVAFLQGAFFPPIPNFRQQLLELGETALLEPGAGPAPAIPPTTPPMAALDPVGHDLSRRAFLG